MIAKDKGRKCLKKSMLLIMMTGIFSCLMSCVSEEMTYIFTPVEFEIEIINDAEQNLLEASTPGNLLETEMYVKLEGVKYEVQYGKPQTSLGPFPGFEPDETNARWYFPFIAPDFNTSSDQTDKGNRLNIGQFPGNYSGTVTFELIIGDESINITYQNNILSGLGVDRHFYVNGKEISSSSFTLVY